MSVKINAKIVRLYPCTAKVTVDRIKKHRLYGKQYKVTKNYLVDNPKNIGAEGDLVEIVQIKPVSKRKRWALSKILKEVK